MTTLTKKSIIPIIIGIITIHIGLYLGTINSLHESSIDWLHYPYENISKYIIYAGMALIIISWYFLSIESIKSNKFFIFSNICICLLSIIIVITGYYSKNIKSLFYTSDNWSYSPYETISYHIIYFGIILTIPMIYSLFKNIYISAINFKRYKIQQFKENIELEKELKKAKIKLYEEEIKLKEAQLKKLKND